MMVAAGLTMTLRNYRVIARALRSMAGVRAGSGATEIPFPLWMGGFLGASALVLVNMALFFHIPVWMGGVAIAVSFVFAIIAVRCWQAAVQRRGTSARDVAAGRPPGEFSSLLSAGWTLLITPAQHAWPALACCLHTLKMED